VYYTLQLDSFVTPLGSVLSAAPLALLRGLTWGVWAFEWAATPLVLLPVAQPWPRRIAIAGLTAFHLGTLLTLSISSFPLVMITAYVLWLRPEEWDRLAAWASRWSRPVVAYYDDTCGFCQRCCQILALADRGRRIEFIGASQAERRRHAFDAADLESSLVVFDATTGRRSTRATAFAALFGALPLPYQPLRAVALPGIVRLADRVYDFVARHRYDLSRRMGFVACGLAPVAEATLTSRASASATSWQRTRRVAANAVAAYLLLTTLADSWNQSVAAAVRARPVPSPLWLRAPSLCFDLVQGWRMFAPDPFRGDGWWIAAARSRDGRDIDLLTGAPLVWEKPRRIAAQHDVFWRTYFFKISQPRFGVYRQPFARWLVDDARRRGTDAAGFEFDYMQEDTLPPGSPRPFPVQRFTLFGYDAERDVIVRSPLAGR
jgi:predicted DCC family thiol-disulfide oxidoreductase YuxK